VLKKLEHITKWKKNKVSKVNRAGSESIPILIGHWRWLVAQGPSYKDQATSCKRQAASLTRKHYSDIVSYKIQEKVNNEN
jgi:hypothetical protein